MRWPWLQRTKKHVEFKRINCSSVTETLMRATEQADRMEFVVVLYETHDSEETPGGLITQKDVTLAEVNWLLDQAKVWLFSD